MSSGPNIPEAQRGTVRLTLRLTPETMARLRELAAARGTTLAGAVTALLAPWGGATGSRTGSAGR